ncbi:ferredoxin--NADP reductase [Sphingobium chungbukense]|uniref:3-ketosteroid-9-alpha-hydroxylase n=1 Tax=Sphingobium chungbukense TaxID=56193 RepID=A0A0M3AJV2_9SPHN|nr:ferredoxin--NADP reductase [Sphingobium chungbukense]KKW90367.1 hypothetical protein YP76_20440 [Sphingobium chungbukense]
MKLARTLTISEVSTQGSDAVQISLTRQDGTRPELEFRPGQYLTVAAELGGEEHWRCYSITSPAEDRQSISVLVRRVAGGRVSNWLCDHAKAGGQLRVLPPAGRFTLVRPGTPVLLLAGGSGIAPIFSLARQALSEGAPRVRLFYANRDRATLMLADALRDLESQADGRLEIRYWFDSEDGLPTELDFHAETDRLEQADVYLCGPEPFMRGARSALIANGHPEELLHQESYAAEDQVDDDTTGLSAKLTVRLKGEVHAVDVKPGQPLLSAMLAAGLHVPHSCKVGECASCMCRIVSGAVEMTENSVLDEDDVADGWILACSSRPTSDELTVSFS